MFFADIELSYLLTLYLAIAVVNPAALEPARDQCADDAAKYCFGWTSVDQRDSCLRERREELSKACAESLPRDLAAWERGPCAKERKRFCRGMESDRKARLCLLLQSARLGAACRDHLDRFLLLDPCSIEKEVYCRGSDPDGSHRCLVQYALRLTEDCREDLKRDPASRKVIERRIRLDKFVGPGMRTEGLPGPEGGPGADEGDYLEQLFKESRRRGGGRRRDRPSGGGLGAGTGRDPAQDRSGGGPAHPEGVQVDMDQGRQACGTDVMNLCGGPGSQDDIIGCLLSNRDKLSPSCSAFVDEQEGAQQGQPQGQASSGKPCRPYKRKFCRGMRGREARRCLRSHMGELSSECVRQLDKRGGGGGRGDGRRRDR